eukprot:jgi/Orpsp1_1/1178760/evm.model.c7180000066632.1
MGKIIDSIKMFEKYKSVLNQNYFIDKSNIIIDFNKLIKKDNSKNVCITKPRRFGKTSIAAMLVTYYNIKKLHPDSEVLNDYSDIINENLYDLYLETNEKLIIIIDEWDYILTNKIFTEAERNNYISFLKDLIKDQPYTAFTYMTGICPIAKDLSQFTINCFNEYSMINDQVYYNYFGFTEEEVKDLCKNSKTLKYEDLEYWYSGYRSYYGDRIFNPLS